MSPPRFGRRGIWLRHFPPLALLPRSLCCLASRGTVTGAHAGDAAGHGGDPIDQVQLCTQLQRAISLGCELRRRLREQLFQLVLGRAWVNNVLAARRWLLKRSQKRFGQRAVVKHLH
eukprot:CAMPEP_0181180112 /NCGR_PEP_ID=MMETSP1096-20121128/6622_1 /TAXON_ID=156174 ORGANISM="Chrysochromulina ericina, Strain CCMP281" /NCGR_SAMPLE_ID=MMETSP1096 /ASSEMBLY_ACC=CAM_ASM_000453 /LENGTH=116 /DNA_ID=CAMNT_0023268511 /DNA_START=479 /DNA_END=829 /DNA_ORIENTATION=-